LYKSARSWPYLTSVTRQCDDTKTGLTVGSALYSFANSERYKQAITDFEAVLTLKRMHRNTRKYLVETQVAYGQE